MTYIKTDDLLEPQANWYRSQIRLPKTLNEKLQEYVEKSGQPLNTSIMKLIDKGLKDQFSVVKDFAGEQDALVINLPTAVIALTPDYYPELTLTKGLGNWTVDYHGLKAVISDKEGKQLLDVGFKEVSYNKYQMPSHRKIIFTEINSLIDFNDGDCLITHNEKVRINCCQEMNDFFKNYPDHKLIKFEFKSRIQRIRRKDQEILYGIRIWYSYVT